MTYSPVRAAFRLTLFLSVTFGLLVPYLVCFPLGNRARRLFAKPFYLASNRLTGLRVKVLGKPAGPGTLYAANHASYLDIPVLCAITDGLFVAMAEVRGWPLFGFLAAIGRTIFVSRQRTGVTRERLAIAGRLADGEAVFLFPEGSSSDGARVMPFRTALMTAAAMDPELDVVVQPVTIAYGPDADQGTRDRYAWYGDMDLAPHLLRLFGTKERLVVEVRFHGPRHAHAFPHRRHLADWAQSCVADGLARSLGHALPDGETDAAA